MTYKFSSSEASLLASIINRHINHTDNPSLPELKIKDIGYKGY